MSLAFQGMVGTGRFNTRKCQPCLRTSVSYVSGLYTAAKKVSAAPHRGNANRPLTNQGKAQKPDQGKAKNPGQGKAKKSRSRKGQKSQFKKEANAIGRQTDRQQTPSRQPNPINPHCRRQKKTATAARPTTYRKSDPKPAKSLRRSQRAPRLTNRYAPQNQALPTPQPRQAAPCCTAAHPEGPFEKLISACETPRHAG